MTSDERAELTRLEAVRRVECKSGLMYGEVERFNRTLAAEWPYARTYASDEARAATYQDWIHHCNHHRPHTGIGGAVPADRVHNLTGKYG